MKYKKTKCLATIAGVLVCGAVLSQQVYAEEGTGATSNTSAVSGNASGVQVSKQETKTFNVNKGFAYSDGFSNTIASKEVKLGDRVTIDVPTEPQREFYQLMLYNSKTWEKEWLPFGVTEFVYSENLKKYDSISIIYGEPIQAGQLKAGDSKISVSGQVHKVTVTFEDGSSKSFGWGSKELDLGRTVKAGEQVKLSFYGTTDNPEALLKEVTVTVAGEKTSKNPVTKSEKTFRITAGHYGMGVIADSSGQPVTAQVTAKIGDTIDLNQFADTFMAGAPEKNRKIYKVSLSRSTNPTASKTLTLGQSQFTLTEDLAQFDQISLAYWTAFSDQDSNTSTTKPSDSSNKADNTAKTESNVFTAKDFSGYTDEQVLAAQVWYTLTDGQYPFLFYRKDAGTPINYHNGIGKTYPSVTYHLYEDSKRAYAYKSIIDYADNGDGTITLYNVPKHWQLPDSEAEAMTETILNTAKIIKLKTASKATISQILSGANFKPDADTGTSKSTDKQQTQGENTGSGLSNGLVNKSQVNPKDEQKGDKKTQEVTNQQEKAAKDKKNKKKASLPQTGDQSQGYGLVAVLLAALGLGGLFYKGRHD